MPKPSPTQLAGLHAIHEMHGVKVWSACGINSVSPASNYGGLKDSPANRTIQALRRRGLVEVYRPSANGRYTMPAYTYYRLTAAGKEELGI